MATKYNLTTAFTAITETSGTIQNVGNESVELASSTNAVAGEGIVLNPGEKRSFKGALSARSLGDTGAEVNVVDFTEAGEGGEEYILPIASDTTLGGVKISNSFTVANDGTLSIKKSGKTILGAVKSSDDEGKVTVNNDGTMTYNPLGYRQPSTAYTAGQIAYHSALPTGWYLECTTEGTSGSGDLTISSPAIGNTVSDGTLVWTIHGYIVHRGSVNDTNDATGDGIYFATDQTANLPTGATWSTILTLGMPTFAFQTCYPSALNNMFMRRKINENAWTDWVEQEAIVAKSLGTNGYIKYASGLILQWGWENSVVSNTDTKIYFPISFSRTLANVITQATANSENIGVTYINTTDFTYNSSASVPFSWVAIGN